MWCANAVMFPFFQYKVTLIALKAEMALEHLNGSTQILFSENPKVMHTKTKTSSRGIGIPITYTTVEKVSKNLCDVLYPGVLF